MSKSTLTISELTYIIKQTLESDSRLNNVFVCGEISNLKLHSSGHIYFTLKDEGAKIKCVMFRGNAASLKFIPEDGIKVIARGNVSLYERDGQYQLYIYSMQPEGIGSLYLAYEQLKKKLEAEGLFDISHKKAIPMFPTRIGVATSQTGSVIRDIINVSLNRYNKVNILLYPVKVQGDGAARSIVKAIDYFNEAENVDVIIIGRGGGSIEELWPFNEEIVARAIYNSRIPIISAVGHETDFTISDFAADVRASTPSHAAEIAVPSYDGIKYRLGSFKSELSSEIRKKVTDKRYYCDDIINRIDKYSPRNIVQQNYQYIDGLQNKLTNHVKDNFSKSSKRFAVCINKLEALSPLNVLKRGYAYVEKENGIVKSVNDLEKNDNINLHIHDGIAYCKVLNIEEEILCQQKRKM